MRRRRAILASIAAAALVVACRGDRVLQTFDGPVKVDSVQYYSTQGYCDYTQRPNGYPRLVVREEPKIEIVSYCSDPLVKQHGPKKLVAFRCPSAPAPQGERWRIVRRLGGGRWIEECFHKSTSSPDLDRVAPIVDAAPALIACTNELQDFAPGLSGNPFLARRYKLVAEEVMKAGGPEAVSAMLEKTLDEAPLGDEDADDGWVLEAQRLEPGARASLLQRVCTALVRGDSSSTAYGRAARICPLDTPEVKTQALARMSAFNAADQSAHGFRDDDAWSWMAAIAVRSEPKAAGKALCIHVTRPTTPNARELTALGATGFACSNAPDGGVPESDPTRGWGNEVTLPPPRPHRIARPGHP